MERIERPIYLEKLKESLGDGRVKVITGARRAGKSYLLFTLFKEYLLKQGVDEGHIIELSLEPLANSEYRDLFKFADYFRSHRKKDGKTNYFLIDEVQMVRPKKNKDAPEEKLTFVDALNEFLSYGDCEIFVTGSNSKMLSKDIITEFRGRGHQIKVYPLSFREYSAIKGVSFDSLRDYLIYGGFPGLLSYQSEAQKRDYLFDLAQETYIRDIVERNRIDDDANLRKVFKILASNIGSLTNVDNIANTFISREKESISNHTVANYIKYLDETFVVMEAERYDLSGRKYIGGNSKFYFVDCGLRNAVLNFRENDLQKLVEQAIYLDLLSRGYAVDVGTLSKVARNGDKVERKTYEVDFVTNNSDRKAYIQVAYSIDDESKFAQETFPFKQIDDCFRRIVVSSNYGPPSLDEQGYMRVGLLDFLTLDDLKVIM